MIFRRIPATGESRGQLGLASASGTRRQGRLHEIYETTTPVTPSDWTALAASLSTAAGRERDDVAGALRRAVAASSANALVPGAARFDPATAAALTTPVTGLVPGR